MRFLFINQYYAPDFAATAQQMTDLCERLAAAGHDVDVIASRALYDGREIALPAHEVINGVSVHRVSLLTKSRRRFRHRLTGYVSFMAGAFWKANRVPRPDVVVALTTPPLVCLLGAWLKRFRRTRFVFWVMDIYPDIAEKAGLLRRHRMVAPVWSWLARKGYHSADRLIVLGHCMRDVLIGKGVDPSRIDVLPNWSAKDEVFPVAPAENAFRRRHLRPGQFTVMYSGNMGACHTFAPLFKALPTLNGGDNFDFLFVGSGKKRDELREKLGILGKHVRFLPYQERGDLAASLSAPDAHLITLDPRFDGLLVPSKIYGIMAASRPIVFVGSGNNEVASTIREANCGLLVDPEDPAGLLQALRQLAADPEEAAAMGQRGRAHLEAQFEREQATERFRLILEREAREGDPQWKTFKTPSGPNPLPETELPLVSRERATTPVPE
ncbi:MAG: hypothetical protein PWP23_637 [Candidatus Sumerlaeota bacterium]|nr:hypothetical protein [Candidatus Sumerlaeota bacterium]